MWLLQAVCIDDLPVDVWELPGHPSPYPFGQPPSSRHQADPHHPELRVAQPRASGITFWNTDSKGTDAVAQMAALASNDVLDGAIRSATARAHQARSQSPSWRSRSPSHRSQSPSRLSKQHIDDILEDDWLERRQERAAELVQVPTMLSHWRRGVAGEKRQQKEFDRMLIDFRDDQELDGVIATVDAARVSSRVHEWPCA